MHTRRLRKLSFWLLAGVSVGSASAGCESDGPGLSGAHGAANGVFPGPHFPGAGSSAAGSSLAAGTQVVSCDSPLPLPAGTFGPAPHASATQTCFYTAADPHTPAATMEWIVESAPVGELVHVRLTLNPDFVDNTYGDNAIGWPAKAGPMPAMGGKAPMGGKKPAGPAAMGSKAAHTFMDLVGSDHAEFKLTDAHGALVLSFDADYISADASAPSGFGTLGVRGGEGKLLKGSASDVVAVSTSIDRDLNACGLSGYLDSSPATDLAYTPNPLAPKWDYRVVYDVWVKRGAFGAAGFGAASVDFVHASPSKASDNTLIVEPGPCPSDWPPYCADPAGCCVEIDSPACSGYMPTPKPPVEPCTVDCPIGI
ncbi:MAG: hypothetical protein JWN04_4711 [Myxococcaceae bacterium]|nr:hypothetical protein [Myxococcaceae bacterium]